MFSKPINTYLFIIISALVYPNLGLVAQGLNITTGANIVVNGSANIIINNGAFTNSGTFASGTGTVSITGSAVVANTYIGGSSNTSFYNLEINKSGGGAKLTNSVAVSHTMLMTNRNFDLNGFDVNLGSTGNMSGENESSYIFGPLGGYIVRSITLNAPSAVNAGNMGLEITSATNMGASIIKRGHPQQVTSSGFSINRYFDVFSPNNSELNATVKFHYLNAELAGINESELQMWGSVNSGSSWALKSRDTWDVDNNYVTKNNVGQLNRVTLASAVNNPLPITLLYFTGQLENNLAKLSWATSAEVDNDHFEVQRSSDGRNFLSIATIAGAGTSTASHNYSYLDVQPFSNIMYYRLKQVNRSGSFTFSNIVAININALYNNRLIQVYPNPVLGPVSISFTSSVARQVTIQVTDVKGKIILNKVVDASKGLNLVNANLAALAQGAYFLRVVGIDDKAFKIFKY